MWLNQDQMFAEEEPLDETQQRTIKFLDELACRIADREVEVERFDFSKEMPPWGQVWTDPKKTIEVTYK